MSRKPLGQDRRTGPTDAGCEGQLAASLSESDKMFFTNRIDQQIDSLVYELYGLTDGEVKVMEDEGGWAIVSS